MAQLEVELSSGARHRIPLARDSDPYGELLRFVAGDADYRGSHGWIQTETGDLIQVGAVVSVRVAVDVTNFEI